MERGPYLRFAWRVPAGVRVVPNYGSPALGHAEGQGAPFPNPELQPAEQARQIDAAHQALRPSWLDLSDEGLAGYAARFGFFDLPALGLAAGLGGEDAKAERLWPIVEPLTYIRLAVAEYHLALALGAAVSSRGRFDERLFLAAEQGGWRLRWKLPKPLDELPDGLALTQSAADDGDELLREPRAYGVRLVVRDRYLDSWTSTACPVRAATPRDAALEWYGLLMGARAGAWARWDHEQTDEGLRLFAHVTSPLGLAWHRLAGGPAPMRCQWRRCGQPFQASPGLRRGHAAYCSERCEKAANRARKAKDGSKKAPRRGRGGK